MTIATSPTRPRLLCIGDLVLDLTITVSGDLAIGSDSPGTIDMHGGGSAANVAAWASRAGVAARLVGVVGDDQTGEFLTVELESHDVEVRPIVRRGARSRTVAAIVGADGNRSLVSDLRTVVAPTVDDFHASWLDDTDWIHLTAYTYIAEHSRELFRHLTDRAAERHIPVSIDPSAAQLLATSCDHADVVAAFAGARVLFPSHDEAEYLTGLGDPAAAAVELLELAETAAVTCGADGAHVADRNLGVIHVAAEPVDVVNTLGCGDAFAGGFVAAVMRGADPHAAAADAIRSAARAAALPAGR